MFQATLSRRRVLQSLMAAASGLAGAGRLAHAQGFDVTPWPRSQTQPSLQANDLAGKVWRLSELRGRAVLLNFWASWCEPCRAEMPTLEQLAEFYGDDQLVVLAINFKESERKVSQYVKNTGIRLPILPDLQGNIAKQWGVSVFPTTILIDAKGQVRQRVRGEVDWADASAAALVEPLLDKRPQRARGASIRRSNTMASSMLTSQHNSMT